MSSRCFLNFQLSIISLIPQSHIQLTCPKPLSLFFPQTSASSRFISPSRWPGILLVLLDRNLRVVFLMLFFPFLFYVQSITPSCLLYSLNISFIQPVISIPVATIPNQAFLLYHFQILQSGLPTVTLAFSIFVSLK